MKSFSDPIQRLSKTFLKNHEEYIHDGNVGWAEYFVYPLVKERGLTYKDLKDEYCKINSLVKKIGGKSMNMLRIAHT